MTNKNKNQSKYTQFTHSSHTVFMRHVFNYFKKTSSIITIIALVALTANVYFFVNDVSAAGLDDITVTLVDSEAINTTSQVQVVFTFGTLSNGDTLTIYLGEDTSGTPWQLNAVTTTDISCTDDGTSPTYTTDSVTAASGTAPMQTTITATTVGGGAAVVTCLVGDGTPSPINPNGASGYAVAVVTSNDSGAGIAYVGNANDVTVAVDVLPNLALTIDNPDATNCTITAGVTSCDLGVALTTGVNTGTYDVNVGTNATSGVTLSLAEDGNIRNGGNDINDVADNTVSAGSEEYGVALTTSGTWTVDATYIGIDAPVISGPDIAATTSGGIDIAGDDIGVEHKAAISSTTIATTYTHIVTWTATANF